MAYSLTLPISVKIHNVFHIVFLKQFVKGSGTVSAEFLVDLVQIEDNQGSEEGGDVTAGHTEKRARAYSDNMGRFH